MNSESVVLNLNDSTLWAPYKELFNVVYNAITQKDASAIQDLEVALKRHKPDLICLLRNPSQSPIHRVAVKQASTIGIAIVGRAGLQILPQSLVDETLIISDMFELNELTSLELFDCWSATAASISWLLVQAREGRTWTLGVSAELSAIIMRFTNQLKDEGIVMKVIDLLEKIDVTKELELLHRNRALGGPRYRKQVTDLICEIKQTLAEILFGWACQGSFTEDEVSRLLTYLSKQTGVSSDGSLDDAALTTAMAFLYVIDVSILQTSDEMDAIIQKLNLVCVPNLGSSIHKQLILTNEKWQMPGLKSIFQLAWGVTLRTMSQFPVTTIGGNIGDCLEDDEKTIDTAIEDSAFQTLRSLIVKNSVFHEQIALYKFIRVAGDLLPPPLFVPYHQMLTSLSNSPSCAHNCFTMLKMNNRNGSQASIVSWDHFFATLHRYYTSLHEEDEIARITLSENPQYVPTVVILGLVTCSIPATLKAALINCLAAFAESPEVALNIWQGLEMAQIIPTVKSLSVYHPSGILMELEEVETRMEEYPVTRAMLNLLDSLLNHPYPSNLGSGSRQPGIEPYLQFVRDSVLLRCNSRSYKAEGEKKHFNFQSPNAASKSNVGMSILSQMLQDSGLLRVVLFILDEGMRVLDQYASVPGQSNLEECTLLALKLVHATLIKQEAFLQQVRDSGYDLLVTSLENLLLNINPRSGQADHLLVIAKYVTYNAFIPKHSLYSISILHALCSSIQISQHLVGVFDSDSNESEVLLKGFVEILEIDVAGEDNDEESALQTRNKAREQLLRLVLKCLRQPGPNLAHYLLGFNLRKPIAQTEIQEPGVMGSKRTCLHAILSFLDIGCYSGTPSNVYNSPRSAELSYQLLYLLCTNNDTSGPTLRYLRSTHDFLFRHLQCLPFKFNVNNDVKILRQQSWLLRTLAVELRITSAHHQRSHVQRLLGSLLDDKPPIESGTVDSSLEPSFGISNISSYSFMKPTSGTSRRKLMQILDRISFQHSVPLIPGWEYFENTEIERVLKECEVQEPDCPRLIDVEELHSRLSEETLGLQGASFLGQRPVMMQEISKVLEYAVSCNEARESVFAKRLLFDAWRQVTEVLLIACPLEILGSEKKDQMVLEVSQDLLTKIMQPDVLPELMPSASGVILTLMSTLRHSMVANLMKPVVQPLLSSAPNNTFDSHAETSMIPLTHHSSLLAVLKAVIDCLLKTGTGFQRVRANFYSAFLNLLCIVQKPHDIQSSQGVASSILDQESEAKKLRTEYMEIILSFGETIMEIICRDACTGHDITKMLSLAVLDVIVSLDTQQHWLAFLVSKGYLRHILDSLSKDDEELQTLLRNGAIIKLAECRALDLRPDLPNEFKQESSNWAFPDLLKCYRQMFMAIMKLILSIAMTLGSGHRVATLQLLEFVVYKGELFSHVIRDPSNLYSLEALEELSVISAVLSRASFDDPNTLSGDTYLSGQRGHLLLLRQHMMMLIPRLMAIENVESNQTNNNPEILARMKMYRLQIASHVLGSCCSVISKSGIDMQNSTILFGPYIAEASSDSFNITRASKHSLRQISKIKYTDEMFPKRLPLSIGRSPDLGLLISLLYRSASELQLSIDEQKLLNSRLKSLATLTSDELAEYLPPASTEEQPTVQHQREFVRASLNKLIKYKAKEISTLSYMIETSAFILFKYLDFFFITCKKENLPFSVADKSRQQIRRLQDPGSPSPLSPRNTIQEQSITIPAQFDFESFKNDVKTTLGDPFFRKLKSVEQLLNQDKSEISFLDAIVNCLKRLVKIQIR
ncbi:nuclear pore complex protein Nup205 [Caerostris extrusa]|uniref:Nuclear pore complex protein Nup205 n=1 Tax=Caerostris extrusa TaxID=172846 RepID=A0AAV4TMC2_CAEEX|nr:nuclear pore complex protein Nup205 [Caerostris extrusa]